MASSKSEIWDDSALIQSWNDALEEYNKYHSIKSCEENATDKLSSVAGESSSAKPIVVGITTDAVEEDSNPKTPAARASIDTVRSDDIRMHQEPSETIHNTNSESVSTPALPQQLVGQVHDERLKNLLMSWYYAGYYTGLYEGQQHT